MPVDQVNDYKGRGDVLKHQTYSDAVAVGHRHEAAVVNPKRRCGRFA